MEIYTNKAYNHDEIQMQNNLGQPMVSLAWHNFRFEVKNWFGSNKVILRRLNGHLNYNSLNGFLGPSGAGKTTLLNCLNGTIRSGISSDSQIYINQRQQSVPVIRFVQQHVHETIIGKMTIRQVLYYAFRFKNGRQHLSKMNSHIANVLHELMLDERVLETEFKNCSGGEQRRIAIAQELMSLDKPTFLFVDEPTTGLDSNAAYLMMQCLRNLANGSHPVTIIVSIHAPSSDIMALFDKIYILAKGGVCIYSDSPKYLQAKLEETTNHLLDGKKPVIEEYLTIACHGIESKTVRKLADSTLLEEHRRIVAQIDQLRFLPKGIEIKHKPFTIGDLFLQLYRMLQIVFLIERHKLLTQMLFFCIVFPVLACLFEKNILQIKMCGPSDWVENDCFFLDYFFSYVRFIQYKIYQFSCNFIVNYTCMTISAVSLISKLKILQNEHLNRWYGLGTFYWSFLTVHLLEATLISTVVSLLIYFTFGHQILDNGQVNWLRVMYFLFFVWISIIYAQSVSKLLCLIFPKSVQLVWLANLLWLIVYELNSNLLLNKIDTQSPLISLLSKLIYSKIISNGLIYTLFGFQRCRSEADVLLVLQDFGADPDTLYTDVIDLAIHIALINVATILLLYYNFSMTASIKRFTEDIQIKWIDYDDNFEENGNFILDLDRIHRIKHENELKFENFARNKIIVAWRSVTLFASQSIYEVRSATKVDPESKLILRNLNGQFRFGTLNGLMGTSGAGKTSLLKVLSGRSKTRLSMESEFYLSKFTPIRICYITQQVSGHLMPGLTVKQSLIYASKLKNASEDQTLDHEHIALNILKELDLADTADTMVQHCSGGQRKRLALGLELTSVRMPNLICIDEPTSGLDSNSSEVVIGCLLRLTHAHNITIIASVHQPNSKVLMMFDQLYVLAKGGVCIYSGKPKEIRKHLSQISNGMDWQEILPIEVLIKYSCFDHTESVVQELIKLTTEQVLQEDDELSQQTQRIIDGIPTNRNRFSWKLVLILLARYWQNVKQYLYIQKIFFISLFLVFGFIIRTMVDPKISQVDGCINFEENINRTCQSRDFQEIPDMVQNYVYTIISFDLYIIMVLIQVSLEFYYEKEFFFNERRNGWYSTGSFYLMKTIAQMVLFLLVIPAFTLIINIVQPLPLDYYCYLLMFIFICSVTAQGFSLLMIIAIQKDLVILFSIIVGEVIFFLLNSNVITPVRYLHYVIGLLANFSLLRYANEVNFLLQYGRGRCKEREISIILNSHLGIKYEEEHFTYCFIMMTSHLFLYHGLAILLFMYRSNPFQNRRARLERIIKHQEQILKQPLNVNIPGLDCHYEFTMTSVQNKT